LTKKIRGLLFPVVFLGALICFSGYNPIVQVDPEFSEGDGDEEIDFFSSHS
jgi:hypothetical protein